jgi:two-component system CheB/CheR fusion protein
MTETEQSAELDQLLDFIRDERGFDFTGYKRPSLERRIRKRMEAVKIDDVGAYRRHLADHPDEFNHLFNTILINVTSFFRDDVAWDYLAKEIVPRLLETKDADEPIRVWSTGCASGEEAFTLAMILAEALGPDAYKLRMKIYATDVDDEALAEGRHATYSADKLAPVPEALREKYLERVDSGWCFKKEFRRAVIFGRHDLIQDPPISKIDLLVARNTLMYFNTEAQYQILRNFHFSLRPTGYLFLGKSEMIANRSELFRPVDLKRRVFAPVERAEAPRVVAGTKPPVGTDGRASDETQLQTAGMDAAPIAQLVIDRQGTLSLASLQARMLFGLSQRDIGRPFQDLEVSYRPVELRSRIEQAYADRHTITLRDVESRSADDVRFLDIQVSPLVNPTGEVVGCSITFTDITRYHRLQQALSESKHDVETAYEELQSTVEELETTNEELQSTNEELETTNEELQSTNEELETTNEELQSTNEELSTINDELQQRTDELNDVNAYLESILGSLGAAVVVVDADLAIEGWNAQARELWGLAEDEVRGSHFLNLDIGLPVDELRQPIRSVLARDEREQEVVLAAVDRRGRPVDVRVRLSPLDGADGARGVIMLMEPDQVGADGR